MSQQIGENDETTQNENVVKPTITIAEQESGDPTADVVEKPTITIAEKDGGN